MAPITPKQNNTTNIGPPPPIPVQTSRVHTTLTPADSFPRVDMIPPTVAIDREGDDKEEPISDRIQAIRTTPIPSKPLPSSPEPVVNYTRSQMSAHGISHHVTVENLQAARRRLPGEFILDWDMPFMDNVTCGTLKHRELCLQPKYQNIWIASYSNKLGRVL